MRVLSLHTFYQNPGGEDQVFSAETAMLQQYGHEVIQLTADNKAMPEVGPLQQARNTIWNDQFLRRLRQVLRDTHPDVAHFHNTFQWMSPGVYQVCQDERVPVVQTLHNFRLLCLNATFFRDERVCEDCLSKFVPLPGILNACYRDSRMTSAGVAAMLVFHRLLRTWRVRVDRFIALSEFSRQKFIQGGLPAAKIRVKPNFLVHDPGAGQRQGNYAIFAGRISKEKGLPTLIQAWQHVSDLPLVILGDGPDLDGLKQLVGATGSQNVTFLGRLPHDEVLRWIKNATITLLPSQCYEGFPMAILESYACGVPVIVSRLGNLPEVVHEGSTGLCFQAGDPADLAEKVNWALAHPDEMTQMGQQARLEFLNHYTAEQNYPQLIEIYQAAIQDSKRSHLQAQA